MSPRTSLRLIRIHTGAQVALPVRPGDAISATLCLQTDAAGTAFYGLANETTSQTVNFTIETGFPPAHRHQRGDYPGQSIQRPARSAGSIWRGVLRRAHSLRHQWNTEAHRWRADHDGQLQWKDPGDTTTPHRLHFQDHLVPTLPGGPRHDVCTRRRSRGAGRDSHCMNWPGAGREWRPCDKSLPHESEQSYCAWDRVGEDFGLPRSRAATVNC